MAKEKFTTEQIAEALINAQGMKTVAARNLGCDYKTVQRYIDKYVTVREALDESKNRMGDRVESTLLAMALGERGRDGKWVQEPNVTALIFLAKTHPAMRERGYVERREVTGKDGQAIEQKITMLSELSDDELDDIIDSQ